MDEPTGPAPDPRLEPFAAIGGAALMLRAVLDAPDLSDDQRSVAQAALWENQLKPALAAIHPGTVQLMRTYADVAVLVSAFQAGAEGREGAPDPGRVLAQLDAALDRLEELEPATHAEHSSRAATYIAEVRATVPQSFIDGS